MIIDVNILDDYDKISIWNALLMNYACMMIYDCNETYVGARLSCEYLIILCDCDIHKNIIRKWF